MRSTKGGSTLDAAFRGFYSAFSCPLLSRRFSSRHGEERAGYLFTPLSVIRHKCMRVICRNVEWTSW
jgi:hypothetical protein